VTLHILSVNDEQLTIVLQSLLATKNPQAKEVAIRFKNMATPVVIPQPAVLGYDEQGNPYGYVYGRKVEAHAD
jgi:hypothetical protein